MMLGARALEDHHTRRQALTALAEWRHGIIALDYNRYDRERARVLYEKLLFSWIYESWRP